LVADDGPPVGSGALPLLDRRDQITLAHTGGIGEAQPTGQFPQLGQHHARQPTSTTTDRAVLGGHAGRLGRTIF
jgi:hypothetical protein